jgi:hypothetical protein
VVVISGAGDRRDNDIATRPSFLGAAFDDVVLYQDAAQRSRADERSRHCCARAWTAHRARH